MNQLTTVFEITSGTNGIRADALFRMVVGLLALIGGILGLFFRKKTGGRFPKGLYAPAFMTGWAILWLVMHIPLWNIAFGDIDRLQDILHDGGCQITEGIVHVSHEQPATGQTSGDKISVGDQKFEVDYYRVTPGYNRTISHGGALREGAFARLHHYDGVILKVEVRN